jgi:polar amino acid transport system permease protein
VAVRGGLGLRLSAGGAAGGPAHLALPPLEWLIAGYVNYHRNVPGLVQIFVWYFGIPELLPAWITDFINNHNGEFIFALIALSLNSAAYMSEDLRSGMRSVAATQMEAARAGAVLSAIDARRAAASHPHLGAATGEPVAVAVQVHQPGHGHRRGRDDLRQPPDRKRNLSHLRNLALASAFYLLMSWSIMAIGGWYNGRHLKVKGR